jgi:hypothetical protein
LCLPQQLRQLAVFAAIRRASSLAQDFSAKLFGDGLGRLQIGKAPTVISLASSFRNCIASVSRLNVPSVVEIRDLATQSDV